jgi:hypothetical protein
MQNDDGIMQTEVIFFILQYHFVVLAGNSLPYIGSCA